MKSFTEYKNPALATDIAVFGYAEGVLYILLLNRKDAPFENTWTLPGAFLQVAETLAETCNRVLQTKLGLSKVFLEQLYTFDAPDRDPRGRVVSVAHYALINPGKVALVAGSMANDVAWHNVEKLPKLGFDHRQIFKAALARLQSKIVYAPLGFELLDEVFTMPELQQLYECILGIEIDRRNFSRKIQASEFVIATGAKKVTGQNRPPDLYRFNKKLKGAAFNLNIS